MTDRRIRIAVVFALILGCQSARCAAAGKKVYRFGANFTSSGGVASSQFYDITNNVCNTIGKRLDFECRLVKFASPREIDDALAAKKVDIALINQNYIFDVFEKNVEFYPWATITLNRQRKQKYCLWQSKHNSIPDPGAIRGKTIAAEDFTLYGLTLLRSYLAKNGIDEPLWKVFSGFIIVPSQNSALMVVASRKADFFWESEEYETYLKLLGSSMLVKLKHNYCTDYTIARPTIIVNKKTVSKADFTKIKNELRSVVDNMDKFIEKDDSLMALKQYLAAVKWDFIVADDDEFQYERKLYQEAKQKGWLREAQHISAAAQKGERGKPVEVRPSYELCQKSCKKEKDWMKCVEVCMGK